MYFKFIPLQNARTSYQLPAPYRSSLCMLMFNIVVFAWDLEEKGWDHEEKG